MRTKMTSGLIILGTLIFIFPQLAFSADICLMDSSGNYFYLDLNEGSGVTGYIDVGGPANYPVMGSYSVSGSDYYLNLEPNLYCGDGFNPAKFVIKLSASSLSGPSWAHVFRCDGTIAMFDTVSFSLCNSSADEMEETKGSTWTKIEE